MRLPFRSALSASRSTARRHTRLRLDPLEPRVVPANLQECIIKIAENHILQIYGTEQADVINITQESDGIRVICNGHDPQTFMGIDQLWLRANRGGDVLNMDFAPGGLDSVWVDLGGGNDEIDISIVQEAGSPPPITSSMNVKVLGGQGIDDVEIYCSNAQPEAPYGIVVDVQGGAGDDYLSVIGNGCCWGQFDVMIDGGDGADFIQCHTALKIGPADKAQLNLRGGAGVDFFDLNLNGLENFGLFKLDLRGGFGNDVAMLEAFGLNFVPGSDTQIAMLGDAGDDQVAARLNFTSEGSFRLDALGGSGNDLVSVEGAELNFMPDSSTGITMRGDAGNDRINFVVKKVQIRDTFELSALGGPGNDVMEGDMEEEELFAMPDSSTRITMNGEAGDDRINYVGQKTQIQGTFELSTLGGLGNDAVMIEEEELFAMPDSSTRITMNGEAGDDRINYVGQKTQIQGTFELSTLGGLGNDAVMIEDEDEIALHDSSTRITMNGEAGDDYMGIRLKELKSSASIRLDVQGGLGRDELSVEGVSLNFLPESNVQMKISGDAGNDRARFGLHELISLGSLGLDLLGGAGNDALGVDLTSQKVANVLVNVDAGDGADQVNLNFAANIGDFTFTVNAGAGDDLALVRMMSLPPLPGENPGQRMGQFTLDGGAGHDVLSADFSADLNAPETDLVASLLGGMGDDKMRVSWSAAFDANVTADGGVGFDIGLFPPPVKNSNMEFLR